MTARVHPCITRPSLVKAHVGVRFACTRPVGVVCSSEPGSCLRFHSEPAGPPMEEEGSASRSSLKDGIPLWGRKWSSVWRARARSVFLPLWRTMVPKILDQTESTWSRQLANAILSRIIYTFQARAPFQKKEDASCSREDRGPQGSDRFLPLAGKVTEDSVANWYFQSGV